VSRLILEVLKLYFLVLYVLPLRDDHQLQPQQQVQVQRVALQLEELLMHLLEVLYYDY
jgi:hypothetical protein